MKNNTIERIIGDNYPIVGKINITKSGSSISVPQNLTGIEVQLHILMKGKKTVIVGNNIFEEHLETFGDVSTIVTAKEILDNPAIEKTKVKVTNLPVGDIAEIGIFTATIGGSTEICNYVGLSEIDNSFVLDGTNVTPIPSGTQIVVQSLDGKVSFDLNPDNVDSHGSYKYSIKLIKNGITTTYGGGDFIVKYDLK